jgi:hypothetical protein
VSCVLHPKPRMKRIKTDLIKTKSHDSAAPRGYNTKNTLRFAED